MKVLGIVLAILMLLLAGLINLLGAGKAFEASDDLEQAVALVESMGGAKAAVEAELGQEIPSTGRLDGGGFLALLATLAGLVAMVLLFARRKISPHAALACAALAGLTILVYPYIQTGPMDGLAPRTHGVIGLVMGGIAAMGAFLAARKSRA